MKKLYSAMPVLVALALAALIPLTASAEDAQTATSPVGPETTTVTESETCLGTAEWTFGEEVVFDARATGTQSASTCQQNCLSDYERCLDNCSLTDWLCQSRCDHRLRRCESRCPR